MNRAKKFLSLALLAFLSAVACQKPDQPQPDPTPAITIPAQSQTIFDNGISFPTPSGQTQPQTQTVTFTAAESWTSTVADTKSSTWLTVEPSSGGAGTVNMTVKAQPNDTDKTRSATVTIKSGLMSKSFSVTQEAKPAPVAVSEVTLSKTELTLQEGESETLTATVKPDDTTDKTVIWSSSDEAVATVENGKVTAVKEGTATITAKAGEKTASCKVTVSKNVVSVTEITLNKTELALNEGGSETLVATVKPNNATDKTVTWSSSNTAIATVDENGKVTAVKEGTATITAKAGEKSATCTVTVSKNIIAVTSITLNKTTLSLTEGESETLTATVKPDDATDKTVTWSTSDSSIATVDQNGKVTAVKAGSATITAQAGEKSATCNVTVSGIPVASITLNKTRVTLHPGETDTLVATISPDNASDQTITWTSSYPEAVTVDDNGKITAIAVGASTIHASCGGKSASCEVTVDPIPVAEVSLNKTELSLKEGESETLTATVKPDDATDKTVTWSTSDASIATVDQNGKVTAVKAGTATITAKAGDKSATCSVTVTGSRISVSPTSLSFLASGGTKQIQVTSDGDWSVSGLPDWCTLSMSSGSGNATIQLTAVANGGAQRTAQLTFNCAAKTAVVNLTQREGGWENMRFAHKSLFMMFTSVYCSYSATMNEKIHEQDAIIGDKYHRVDVYGRGADNSMGESTLNFLDAPKLENLFWFATPSGNFDFRKRVINYTDRAYFSNILLSAINEQIEYYPPVTGTSFKSSISGKTLSVQGKVYSHEAESFKLTVYLLEDNVTDENSVSHNDVLRMSFTDTLGDAFSIGTKNSTYDFQFSLSLPDEYKTKDLSILVIVQRQYGTQQYGREIFTTDYYVDNCRKAKVGTEAKLELNGYLGGGGNEGIGIDDSISF